MRKLKRPHGKGCGCPLVKKASPALGCPNPTYKFYITDEPFKWTGELCSKCGKEDMWTTNCSGIGVSIKCHSCGQIDYASPKHKLEVKGHCDDPENKINHSAFPPPLSSTELAYTTGLFHARNVKTKEMRNHILNIEILPIKKDQTFYPTFNCVDWHRITEACFVDDRIKPYIALTDWTDKDLIVMYTLPVNKIVMNKKRKLYYTIENITGITKKQIKGSRGKDMVAFSRALFHYGFYMMELGSMDDAVAETNNKSHATCFNSIKTIRIDMEYGSAIRKYYIDKFIDAMKLKPERCPELVK